MMIPAPRARIAPGGGGWPYIYICISFCLDNLVFFAMHGLDLNDRLWEQSILWAICKKWTTILWVLFFGFLLLLRRLPCPETNGDVEIACGQSASCWASGTWSHKQDFWALTTNTWQAQTKDNFHQHHQDILCVMSSIYQGITMNWEWHRSWFTVLWCISCCAILQKYNSK